MDFLVARYGAFVLLKPRFETQTLLLWLLPPLALGLGVLLLLLAARRRRLGGAGGGDAALVALSAEEEARIEELLGNKDFSSTTGATDRPRSSGITKV